MAQSYPLDQEMKEAMVGNIQSVGRRRQRIKPGIAERCKIPLFYSIYNRANEMCTFYKRNVQKKDFFSRQTKSVQSVFEQRLNSRLETQNQTLFS